MLGYNYKQKLNKMSNLTLAATIDSLQTSTVVKMKEHFVNLATNSFADVSTEEEKESERKISMLTELKKSIGDDLDVVQERLDSIKYKIRNNLN